MKKLKQKIEEAAEEYISSPDGFIDYATERKMQAFKAGAQFLLDEGVRYSEEDMRAAFMEGFKQAMIELDKLTGKQVSINEFIKGRGSK